MPKSAIEKQVHNKYDNKQRKSQEKKTERLSFRVSPETKGSFTKLQNETGLPQGTLFESLISNNHLPISYQPPVQLVVYYKPSKGLLSLHAPKGGVASSVTDSAKSG